MFIKSGISLIFFSLVLWVSSIYAGSAAQENINVILGDYLTKVDFFLYFPEFVKTLYILIAIQDSAGISEFLNLSDKNKIAFYFLKLLVLNSPIVFNQDFVDFFRNEEFSQLNRDLFKFIADICFKQFIDQGSNHVDSIRQIQAIEREVAEQLVVLPPVQEPNPTPSTFPWSYLNKLSYIGKYLISPCIGVAGLGLLGYGLYTGCEIATTLFN